MGQSMEQGRRNFISLVEVDRDDSDDANGGWVTFDSFTEEAFHEYEFLHFSQRPGDTHDDAYLTLRAPFKEVVKRYQAVGNMNVGWVRIMVDIHRSEELIPAEVVMFGDNPEVHRVGLSVLEILPKGRMAWLDAVSMLEHEPRTQAGFISGVLDIPLRQVNRSMLAVAVYDVGQGNCNAIVDAHEHPQVYFDLGWSPNFHAKSRPEHQPNFFTCERHANAPVVLSHWDMDHWCYAIKNSSFNPGSLTTRHDWKEEALRRFWIARAPLKDEHKLGPLTMAFYRALANTQLLPGLSAVLLWPDSVKRIPFSSGWLEACRPAKGTPDDRNNNGIAMFVRPNTKAPAILLPGDADFPSIPSISGSRKTPLAGLVAPHHGARISAKDVPNPKKNSLARLVISVGYQNSYGHPKQESIDAYAKSGWLSSRTQDRIDCGRTPVVHRHGNTLLKFSDESDPQCGCACIPDGSLCLVPSATSFPAPVAGIKTNKKSKVVVTTEP